jgi:hypothetical protein
MWLVLRLDLGEAGLLSLLFLAAKSSHVGANVDGLACHLHRPTNCGSQARV